MPDPVGGTVPVDPSTPHEESQTKTGRNYESHNVKKCENLNLSLSFFVAVTVGAFQDLCLTLLFPQCSV